MKLHLILTAILLGGVIGCSSPTHPEDPTNSSDPAYISGRTTDVLLADLFPGDTIVSHEWTVLEDEPYLIGHGTERDVAIRFELDGGGNLIGGELILGIVYDGAKGTLHHADIKRAPVPQEWLIIMEIWERRPGSGSLKIHKLPLREQEKIYRAYEESKR